MPTGGSKDGASPHNALTQEQLSRIGRRLIALREGMGHTQKAWARELKISAPRLNKWESGVYVPALGTLIVIARTCRVSLDWILTGRFPSKTEPRMRVFLEQTVPELFDAAGPDSHTRCDADGPSPPDPPPPHTPRGR